MPLKRKLWGIRQKIPQGFFLGRLSVGDGDVELLTADEMTGSSGLNVPAALDTVSQAEAEAGVSTTVRAWTAQRVAQAIAALGGGGGAGTGSSGFSKVFLVQDEKADGVDGGTSVATTWTKRTLNTVKHNTLTGASVASDVVTLPAGDYYFEGSQPTNDNDTGQTRLRDTDNNVTLVLGTTEFVNNSDDGETPGLISGFFTLSAETDVELQYFVKVGRATFGLGIHTTTTGEVAVYARAMFVKIDSVSDSITVEDITVNGSLIVATQTPASASDTGVEGTMTWDDDFIYICTATDTWKRVAIATW